MAGIANKNPLFEDFKKASSQEWKAKIIKDLKGADFSEKLIWHTYEGLDIQPYYTNEDITASYSDKIQQLKPSADWENREMIAVKEIAAANKEAQEALKKGANALCFDLDSMNPDTLSLSKLLAGIPSAQVPVSFKTKDTDHLLKQIQLNNPSLTALKGSIVFDPIALWMESGDSLEENLAKLPKLLSTFEGSSNFRALTIGSNQFHNAGASAIQELAYTTGVLVTYADYLTEQGVKAETVFNSIEISTSTGTNYFFEIAKIRAFKWLFAKVAASYGVEVGPIRLHAQTSYWSKTVADPYVNMLRNTTEAMAALAGGCTSITVLPYNIALSEEADEFTKRISRNVAIILKEESYFDKTKDPAAGSYYIEHLTSSLIDEAWKLFLETEKQGGIIKAFEKGTIQEEISKVRDAKAKNFAEGKEILVGTNKYINKNEVIADQASPSSSDSHNGQRLLKPIHAYELIKNN